MSGSSRASRTAGEASGPSSSRMVPAVPRWAALPVAAILMRSRGRLLGGAPLQPQAGRAGRRLPGDQRVDELAGGQHAPGPRSRSARGRVVALAQQVAADRPDADRGEPHRVGPWPVRSARSRPAAPWRRPVRAGSTRRSRRSSWSPASQPTSWACRMPVVSSGTDMPSRTEYIVARISVRCSSTTAEPVSPARRSGRGRPSRRRPRTPSCRGTRARAGRPRR